MRTKDIYTNNNVEVYSENSTVCDCPDLALKNERRFSKPDVLTVILMVTCVVSGVLTLWGN